MFTGLRYLNINPFVGLLVTHLRLSTDLSNVPRARLCVPSMSLRYSRLGEVKWLCTPKTPRGLIPRMQTLTRGGGEAGLSVFEESIA